MSIAINLWQIKDGGGKCRGGGGSPPRVEHGHIPYCVQVGSLGINELNWYEFLIMVNFDDGDDGDINNCEGVMISQSGTTTSRWSLHST